MIDTKYPSKNKRKKKSTIKQVQIFSPLNIKKRIMTNAISINQNSLNLFL